MLSESEPGTVFGGSKNFSKSVNTAGNEMTYLQQQFTGFPESSFSISFWMSPNHDITPTSVSQSPYSKGGRPFGVRQKFEALFPTDATDAGKFQIDAANDSDASAPGGHLQSDRTSWGAGEWYHVTLVNNYASSSDGLRLYIDGVLEDTKPRVNMPILPLDYVYGQNFFRIGGSFSSPNRGAYDNNVGDLDIFDGKLADFAIWTKALSECEVKQMAKGPNACSTPCSTCYSPTDIVKPLGMTLELSDPTLDTYLEVNNNLINSGNGFNSSTRTYTGGTSLAYSTGVNNANSLSFDKAIYPNSTAYVRSSAGANDFGVNVPDNGTVSMWIKMSALNSTWSGSSPRIFGANNQNECFINWGGNRIQCDLGSAGTLRSPNDLEANKWYHLAVTWDTTSATKIKKMWLNGELVSTSTSTTKPFAGSNMWIGHSAGVNDLGSNNGQPFNGSIDDIALYRRALSDCEIMKLAKGPNACSEPCITCASPDNKFKVTQTSATYANMDALCKSEYGNNWEFATLDNADENYIMTADAGVPMFPVGTYAIKNTPSDTRPFYDNGSGDPSTNNVCLDERNDPAWPETDKMALFELDTPITGTMPFCYADMPKTNSILGVCRNTTFDSLPACTGSLTASCQPTPSTVTTGTTVNWTTNVSGALGPVTYSWLGTGLTGKTTQVATTSYSSAGVYRATTTVSDTVSSLTVACAAPVSVSPIRYGICPPPPLTYQSRPTSGVCSDSVSIGAVEGDEAGPWRWTCFGSDTTVSTDDDICPAQMAVDFDCSVSMVDQKDRVAVGTNTQWKINGGEDIPSFYKRIWMIAEGDGSYIDVPEQDNNTLNYPFTIVGPKKVRVRFVSKSNPLDVHSCDDNRPAGTTAVLTGGLIEL
jgi:hypothetical protein